MSTVEKKSRATLQEFFSYIQDSPNRAEFFRGEIFDMAGGTKAHSALQVNMSTALNIALVDQPCIVYSPDMMVHILEADAVFFPDVQVVYAAENEHQQELATHSPSVIVEVLSPARASYDRGGKFQTYMKIRSLREYVLIEQETVQVDVFSRASFESDWIYRSYTHLDDQIDLPSLNIQIAMKSIYAKIVFET